MATATPVRRLGRGVYSLPEVARLTRLRPARVREWFAPPRGARGGVFTSDYPPVGDAVAVSFLDLIEVYVAGRLRDAGVSLPTIRRAHQTLARRTGRHPFARESLLTNGRCIFLRALSATGAGRIRDAVTTQDLFPTIIEPFLLAIEFHGPGRLASLWRIAAGVVVNPKICFGRPIVETAGIPTGILAAAFQANDQNAQAVADWYHVTPAQVQAAVAFEAQYGR